MRNTYHHGSVFFCSDRNHRTVKWALSEQNQKTDVMLNPNPMSLSEDNERKREKGQCYYPFSTLVTTKKYTSVMIPVCHNRSSFLSCMYIHDDFMTESR